MAPPRVMRSAFSVFFEYDTPRIVHIRSKKVGIFNRLVQLMIIGYIVGYVIIWKKGYQDFDEVQSAVTSKLKGVVYTNFTDIPGLASRTWDVADYVIPPQENNAFFVMTNVIVTPEQTQGTCGEDPTIGDAFCNNTTPCKAGEPVSGGNGIKTGKCVPSLVQPGRNVCEIYAWCPVEIQSNKTEAPQPALQASDRFTVFIKNNIEFPKFAVQRRNILGFKNDSQLSSCRFDPDDSQNKLCPIFVLSKVTQLAGVSNYTELALSGGVIQIVVTWDCDLDYSEEDCLPKYTFRRLDRGDFKISRGFNFRYADHYKIENGTLSARTLYKAYGIRFIITVQGKAGKISPIPLLLNIASGLALLSIATVICDIFVLYLMRARKYYWDKKYMDVKGDDAYEVLDESLPIDSDGETRHRQASKRSSDDGDTA
ncbi:hypothetical protein ACOMHN_020421 [Nucella lapillus]